jgi:hypothetical protein
MLLTKKITVLRIPIPLWVRSMGMWFNKNAMALVVSYL